MAWEQIERSLVLDLIARVRLREMTPQRLADLLMDMHEEPAAPPEPAVRRAIQMKYEGVSNGFLSEVYEMLTGTTVEVVGEVKVMHPCPCCGFRTIDELGTYDICMVCWWEDDGTANPSASSGPNHGTMDEYRATMKSNPRFYYREKWLKDPL